jgi:hypothetical protein
MERERYQKGAIIEPIPVASQSNKTIQWTLDSVATRT